MNDLTVALDSAWAKIQAYCKQHYTGMSIQDVQVKWKHDTYGWLEFGVTPAGVPYYVRGNHFLSSRSPDTQWYYHPGHQMGYEPARYARMKEIIQDWPVIKEKLEQQFEKEKLIFAFEP